VLALAELSSQAQRWFYLQGMGIFGHFMNLKAVYLHWSWLQISVTNLLIILSMLALFALALVLPFPRERNNRE
jgi:hypothetical protein